MTTLRSKMTADMRLRNLSTHTQRSYLYQVGAFARFFDRSPAELGTDEVVEYLLHLEARGLSPASRMLAHAALRFIYTTTLQRPDVIDGVPRPRKGPSRPGIPLMPAEVVALRQALASQPFEYTIFSTMLDTGLRNSEVRHLQTGDIDRRAGLVHVRRGKGARPRKIKLSDHLYRLLRRYQVVERPPGPWLFPAQRLLRPGVVDPDNRWADHPISANTVRERIHDAERTAGLTRSVTPHDLRRTFGTWLLEAGTNLRTVQVLLGHASPDTTQRYTSVRLALITDTPSPLQQM